MKILRNGYELQFDPEYPHQRFKGGKAKAPAPTPAVPTPRQLDEEVTQKDRDRRRQRIAQAGRGGTILTQGIPLATGSATLLGRSQA